MATAAKKPPARFDMGKWDPARGAGSQAPPDPQATTLSCTVTGARPRFVNEENGFAIWGAIAELDGGDFQLTLKGPLSRVNPGEMLSCKGRWRQHRQHGWGFEVSDYRSALPSTDSGVESWLQARVDGIGPTFAKSIVKHFGSAKVFEILDADPSRLAEVRTDAGRKISAKQLKRAIKAWDQVKTIRQVETFLFSHGVTPGLAGRLYQSYGDEVVDILRQTPYRITEIRGVGFKIADAIALKIGIAKDDPARIKAGILYALGRDRAEKSGHSFLSIEQLLSTTVDDLGIADKRAIVEAAAELGKEGELVVEPDDVVRQRVYAKRWHEIECRLAAAIRELLTAPKEPLFSEPERPQAPEGASREQIERLKLPTDEQWEIMELVRHNRLALLSGGPGVGKSQSINLITDLAEQEGLRVALAAPTGKAARRMTELSGHPASTIHRLLEFSPFEGGFKRGAENPIDAELLVIDEASMLGLDLADSLFEAIGPRTHVLLVGDPDQLPPVGVGKVLDDLINSERVPRVHLSKIFRQAARSMIIQNSRRINSGEKPYLRKEQAEEVLGMKMLNDFFWVKRNDPEATFEMVVDMACNRVPRTFELDPITDIMVLAPMKKGKVGLERLNLELEKRLNPGDDGAPKKPIVPKRGICVGSRIVQSKNDYDHEIMNGEIAIVLDHDETNHTALLSVDDGQRELTMPTADMESFYLAWALSIHKSQGSQFKAVITPVSTATFVMLSRSLTYTAVTRAESLCVMVGEPKALAVAVQKVDTRQRNSSLRDRILYPALSGTLF